MPVAKPIEVTAQCPIRTTMDMLSGKWKLLVIYQLSQQALRFGELAQKIPDVSQKILTEQLQQLHQDQLIEKEESSRQAAYRLTSRGVLALPVIKAVRDFGLNYLQA